MPLTLDQLGEDVGSCIFEFLFVFEACRCVAVSKAVSTLAKASMLRPRRIFYRAQCTWNSRRREALRLLQLCPKVMSFGCVYRKPDYVRGVIYPSEDAVFIEHGQPEDRFLDISLLSKIQHGPEFLTTLSVRLDLFSHTEFASIRAADMPSLRHLAILFMFDKFDLELCSEEIGLQSLGVFEYTQLETLWLRNRRRLTVESVVTLTVEDAVSFGSLANLTELEVWMKHDDYDALSSVFPRCLPPSLTRLAYYLPAERQVDFHTRLLESHPQLVHLSPKYGWTKKTEKLYYSFPFEDLKIESDYFVNAPHELPSLTKLYLSTDFDDLQKLGDTLKLCPNLEVLDLFLLWSEQGDSWRLSIPLLRKLTFLSFYNGTLCEQVVRSFANLPAMETLELNANVEDGNITSCHTSRLSSALGETSLRKLMVKGRCLSLGLTELRDIVGACGSLHYLYIDVTERSLEETLAQTNLLRETLRPSMTCVLQKFGMTKDVTVVNGLQKLESINDTSVVNEVQQL